ncbi:nuclear pore complex assembly-domain-containing protein, partial [Hysterangium stoloniferum]
DPFPFNSDIISNIIARRACLGGELVIDQLLEQASIPSPSYLFPPASLDDLKQLLSSIEDSPWDAQKKTGLCFYLLAYVDPELAQTATALPPHFSALAHACFLLDCGDVPSLQRAVALLADARIVQDLAPKILQILDLAGEPHLVRTYVRTAHPVLQAFEDAEIYIRALLSFSLSEAWTFQRGFVQGSNMRNQLVRVILDACLMPPHTVHLPHLISLPLSAYESALLQAYALSPPVELTPAAHAILQDLLTVRMLSAGKYSDAIRVSRAFAERDTEILRTDKTAVKTLTRAASERSTTMRTVLNVLPAVQRRELEKEFDESSDGATAKPNGIPHNRRSGENGDLSLSGSWEDLAYSSMSASRGRAGRLEGSPAPGGTPISKDTLNEMPSSSVANVFHPTGRFGIQPTPTPTPPPFGPRASSTGLMSSSPSKGPLSSPPSTGLFSNLRRSSPTVPSFGGSTPKGNSAPLFRIGKNTEPAEEDITMIDSDDPDAFVVHEEQPPPPPRSFARRQPLVKPPQEPTAPQISSRIQIPGAFHDEPDEEEAEEKEEKEQRQDTKAE